MSNSFEILPSSMDKPAFIDRFGDVYEHSAWIAEAVWDNGLIDKHDQKDGLASAMITVLEAADHEAKLALIRAHPDLAGKAAVRGELTEASTSEQAGAGLDKCSPEEFERFQELNSAYQAKFGFPFIFAVKGSTRYDILDAFEERIKNSPETEFETALEQINRIASFRLEGL